VTTETTHQINLALRTAAGHARAANDVLANAEGAYEMKMKSAGASVWEAWALAVRAQPEFHGRKLDDKALVRIYESTKPRPWWDKHLSAVKFAGKPVNREWAKRTLQWHTDPNAARARRAKDAAVSAARYKRVTTAQGRQRPQAGAPTTAEMKEVAATAQPGWTFAGRTFDDRQTSPAHGNALRTEIDRLVIRIHQAAGRMEDPLQLTEAVEILRLATEGMEAI
jgi:hypothetical protein